MSGICAFPSGEIWARRWSGVYEPFASSDLDRMAEMQGVPVDDDGGEQVQARNPVVLAFGSAVADLALPADAQGVLQCVMRLALVKADLLTTLHAGVEYPFDDEQGALDPANLAQCGGLVVLARIGGELAQNAAWRDLARLGLRSCPRPIGQRHYELLV